jgi:hypothetical protein
MSRRGGSASRSLTPRRLTRPSPSHREHVDQQSERAIVRIGRGDDGPHRVVVENDVAGALRVRQAA